ncbi:MAG TPA: Shedu anti-phage system protein SduA domain-containing protein, partial [Acetobacteraceae bacterium]|nr:Shedu anti-phage system protein SduA domain-containing protein [Acetobacteraceae bacterium]
MSVLLPAPHFELSQAESQLLQFRAWLNETPYAIEQVATKRLRSLPALCPLLGMYDGRKYPTVQKWEFEIQGVFRADFIAGNPARKEFVLVEFEGAEQHSIFGPSGTNQMRNWGDQIEHGFSQIADWTWAKNESQHSRIFQAALGADESVESYVLICGRDSSLIDHERSRL